MTGRPVDHAGKRFGRWTPLRFVRTGRWICRCDCGTEREVGIKGLVCGSSRSCGCYAREQLAVRATKEAPAKREPLYQIWKAIRSRCLSPSNRSYANYGGRGIVMCQRWQESFWHFLADVGPRPRGASIDRIDNNGPYAPENCRWATRAQQGVNTRANVRLAIGEDSRVLSEWARDPRCAVSACAIQYRLRRGWTLSAAIFTPRSRPGPTPKITKETPATA